jgi:hypothetical protein
MSSSIKPYIQTIAFFTYLGEFAMKTLTFKSVAAISSLVALASLAVIPAYADTPKDESLFLSATNFESIKSRDQVQQEYFQAVKDGSLAVAYDPESPAVAHVAPSGIMREDVYAETVEWLRTKGTDIGMGE